MESNKEGILQVLETAKNRCAQAVMAGDMTIPEYEEATGRDGTQLREDLMQGLAVEWKGTCDAIVRQAKEATARVIARLQAAGLDEDAVRSIVGSPTLQEGTPIQADWENIVKTAATGGDN